MADSCHRKGLSIPDPGMSPNEPRVVCKAVCPHGAQLTWKEGFLCVWPCSTRAGPLSVHHSQRQQGECLSQMWLSSSKVTLEKHKVVFDLLQSAVSRLRTLQPITCLPYHSPPPLCLHILPGAPWPVRPTLERTDT